MQAIQSRIALAPPRRPIQAICIAGMLIIAFVTTAVPVTNPDSPQHLQCGRALSLGTALYLAMASARVIGDGDRLIIRNAFVDVVIPQQQIDHIDTLNGLEVVAGDGKRYKSSAYGQSVLQIVFESRSVQSAGDALERWLAVRQSTSDQQMQIRVRLRRWWYVGLPFCMALGFVHQLALYALTPAIRPIIVTVLEFF